MLIISKEQKEKIIVGSKATFEGAKGKIKKIIHNSIVFESDMGCNITIDFDDLEKRRLSLMILS